MTVRVLIQAYRNASTAAGREDTLHAKWWNDALGEEAVASLTSALLLTQLDRLAAYGRAPSTVSFYFRFFRRVCAWAVGERHLSADPCAGIPLPKSHKPTVRVLTPEEEIRLCAALGAPYDLWVKLAIETGLKLSEQFSLRWREVDINCGQVLLPASTGNAVFHLPVSPTAVSLLRQLRQAHPPSMWVFPDLKTPNRPVNVHSFLSWRWGRAVQEANVPWLTWKDLRTTCGVRLAEQGYSIEDVVARMRQAGSKRAYLYRCTAEKRPAKVTPEAAPCGMETKSRGSCPPSLHGTFRPSPSPLTTPPACMPYIT